MDILQICPPKNLVFSIPNDLHRVLTITNLTLRSLYIYILKSHTYELSLSKQSALMSAFEELKIDVTLNFNQEMTNCSLAKLRIYYYETDEDESEEVMRDRVFSMDNKTQYEEITILYDIHSQAVSSLHYHQKTANEQSTFQCKSIEAARKFYLMRKVYPLKNASSSPKLAATIGGDRLKNQIFNYLQHLNYVASIEECQNNATFLIEFKQNQQDICDFVTFTINDTPVVFVIARIIAYGKGYSIPTLVSIDSDDEPIAKAKSTQIQSPKQIKGPAIEKQKEEAKQQSEEPTKTTETVTQSIKNKPQENTVAQRKKKDITKQSFAVKRQSDRIRTKRRNKSQQKIHQASSQQDDEEFQISKQLRNFRMGANFDLAPPPPPPIKIRHEVKINETNIQLTQKVLNVLIEKKQNLHYIYVLVRDCVRVFMLEDPSFKRVLKFDPIDAEHVGMPTPVDLYNQELLFGNESYLFYVNLQTGASQWKYVQRKYIYALAVVEELSLVAVGGKNFSKLSYFGKETTRSNLKLYSCSSSDKHDHLFTYDFPGTNVGHVANMAYITVPPLATKLLLVHTLSPDARSCFFFLRVKAFNKVEVYGQLQLDELGILNLLKFKYNRDTGRVVCMEALGDTDMDTFKKLKIKCQYEKVQVSTQGFKFPLKRFTSCHLGGCKEGIPRQWMSFVQENGCIFHLYDFQSNKLDTYQLGKGQIRQVFSLYNGKYLVICSDSSVKIRQKVEIEIKE